MAAIRLAIHGAAGRMGKRLVALGSQDPGLQVMAAIEHAACPALGQDAGVTAGAAALGFLCQQPAGGHSSGHRFLVARRLHGCGQALHERGNSAGRCHDWSDTRAD